MIDTNVHLSRWPFRRLRGDENLGAHLRSKGVTRAWAAGFDGVFHLDLGASNARLAEECRRDSLFVPFGTVNPAQVDWEEDLRRCHEVHRMPGLRLYPNYHDYALDDPRFEKLLRAAAERKLLVQIALKLEDPRTQHRLVRVPNVDPKPLAGLKIPGLRLMLLNTPPIPDVDAWFETSAVEGVGALPVDRLLFGSHAPFLTWESARLKLKQGDVDPSVLDANATSLLAS